MSNVIITPRNVESDINAQNRALESLVRNFDLTRDAIRAYRKERGLDGRAFQAHKDYFRDGHQSLILNFRLAITDMQNANRMHLFALGGLVDSYYNRNLILADLERNRRALAWWRSMTCWHLYSCICELIRAMINLYEAEVARLEAMLSRLDTYLERTCNIYDGMDAHMRTIDRGLALIEGQVRCPWTGIVTLPTMQAVIMNELKQDGEPCPVRIRTMLNRVRSLSPKDLASSAELDALAELFMRLDNPEVFINAMGEKIAPGFYMGGVVRLVWMSEENLAAFLERNTIWYFDSDLTNALRDRVELRVAELLENEWLAPRYSDERRSHETDRFRLLPHSALLHVVSNLTPVHFEDTNRRALGLDPPEWNRANPQFSTVLFGTPDSPGISITPQNGGFVVQFAQLDKLLNMTDGSSVTTTRMPDNPRDHKHLTNYRMREIVISEAYRAGYYDDPQAAHTVVVNRVTDSVLANHEFNLGESIFRSVVALTIPGGRVVDVGSEVAGIFVEYDRIQEVRNSINTVRRKAHLSRAMYRHQLNAVFISENSVYEPPQLWFSTCETIRQDRETSPAELGRPELPDVR